MNDKELIATITELDSRIKGESAEKIVAFAKMIWSSDGKYFEDKEYNIDMLDELQEMCDGFVAGRSSTAMEYEGSTYLLLNYNESFYLAKDGVRNLMDTIPSKFLREYIPLLDVKAIDAIKTLTYTTRNGGVLHQLVRGHPSDFSKDAIEEFGMAYFICEDPNETEYTERVNRTLYYIYKID